MQSLQLCSLQSPSHLLLPSHYSAKYLSKAFPSQSHASHYLTWSHQHLVILSLGASDLNSHVHGSAPSVQTQEPLTNIHKPAAPTALRCFCSGTSQGLLKTPTWQWKKASEELHVQLTAALGPGAGTERLLQLGRELGATSSSEQISPCIPTTEACRASEQTDCFKDKLAPSKPA